MSLHELPNWSWVDDDRLARERIHSERLLAVCDAWDTDSGNLFLFGPTGLGKTAALTRMARRWIRSGTANCVFYARELSIDSGASTDKIALAYAVKILILDGPDVVPPQRDFSPLIGDLLRHRLAATDKSTIVAVTAKSTEFFAGTGVDPQHLTTVEEWGYRWDAPEC